MLMLDNGGDLNNTNDLGQTPLAFASLSTLKKLDLENGIATTANSSVHAFDNNKCLTAKKQVEIFKTNDFCSFQLEKMVSLNDKVRMVDQASHLAHLVSFVDKNENREKDLNIKIEENAYSALLPSPGERVQTSFGNSPMKRKKHF